MTTTKQAPPTLEQIERATALVTKLLKGRWHGKRLAVVAAAIGKALVATPPGSEHGQLLVRALRPSPEGAQRPDDERAVFWLALRGETPTPGAVTGALQMMSARRAREERLHAAAPPFVEADGERAAAHVAAAVRDTGTGPTWAELANAMDWPRYPWHLRAVIIEQLARAGWLQTGKQPRSLRPGPMAAGTGE